MKAMKLAAALTAARAAAKKNAPQVNAAIDKAATAAKAKVGPQHHARIDAGTKAAKKAVTGQDGHGGSY